MYIILFIAVLAILILAHELGHFLIAKKNGIRVDEFAIGFPPRLFKIKKGETTYSINLLPIGGYVKIHGEEGEDRDNPGSFGSKSIGVRAMVLAGGVTFNIILGWLLLSAGFMFGLPVSADAVPNGARMSEIEVIVIQVGKDSPADLSGIMPGDKLVGFSSVEEFQGFVEENKGKETEVKHRRGETVFSTQLTPRENPPFGQGAIGVAIDEVGIAKLPWHRAIWEGMKTTYNLTIAVAVTMYDFFVGLVKGSAGLEAVAGPVGIVRATGSMAELGFVYLLSFMALLSINLAVLNIIPFPALDGGRILFLAIEKIKGSPISPKVSTIANTIGFALLIILMIMITYSDILKIV